MAEQNKLFSAAELALVRRGLEVLRDQEKRQRAKFIPGDNLWKAFDERIQALTALIERV